MARQRTVHEYIVLTVCPKCRCYVAILPQLNTTGFEIGGHTVCYLPAVDKQHCRHMGDKQVRHENGIAVYIGSTQIERPCDIVERRHEHALGVTLTHGGTHTGEFRRAILAGILHGMKLDRGERSLGAVFPYQGERVEIGAQRQPAVGSQPGSQGVDIRRRTCHAVDADLGRVAHGELTPKPFGDGGSALHPLFHQHELRAGKLFARSEEVA